MASGGEQKTVSLRTEVHSREDEELRETKDAFYEYMFRKATRDDGLSRTQVSTFEAVREELVSEEEVHENGDAANLGRRLAEIGKRRRRREREGGGGCRVRYLGGYVYAYKCVYMRTSAVSVLHLCIVLLDKDACQC